jgi:uncharacterized coiled-coil protein SlyX
VDRFEERVASLEGRTQEQTMRIDDVRDAVTSLEARMDRRFEQLEVRLDQRFATLDQRFAAIDHRFGAIDQRFVIVEARFVGIDERLDRMSSQLSHLLIGVTVAAASGLLGMITAMIR